MNPMISGCGVEFPSEENRRRLEHRVVLLESADLRLQRLDLGQLLAAGPRPLNVVDLGLNHPPAHRLLANPELPGRHRGAAVSEEYSPW